MVFDGRQEEREAKRKVEEARRRAEDTARLKALFPVGTYEVLSDSARVRSDEDLESSAIESLAKGTRVTLVRVRYLQIFTDIYRYL